MSSLAVTLRFQSTGAVPGSGQPVRMRGPSLTIGRGDENDLVLPDPDRLISKRHCAIEDHNGNIVVIDFSTNGTFLNYGKIALGTTPTPLNDGDILSLGPYELVVSIVSAGGGQRIADPLEEGPVSPGVANNAPGVDDLLDAPGDGGDFLDELLGGREQPVGPRGVNREEPDEHGLLPPLGEDDDTFGTKADSGPGVSMPMHSPASRDHFAAPRQSQPQNVVPDDWDDDFLTPKPSSSDPFARPMDTGSAGGAAYIPDDFGDDFFDSGAGDTPSEEVPPAKPAEPVAPVDPVPPVEPGTPAAVPQAPSPAGGASDVASLAFLNALGASDVRIDDAELPATMERLGKVLRTMVEGVREILMTRTSIKSEFRIEQTVIRSGGNNPLKFSISPEQAIEAMVRPTPKGYLEATEAADQALRDIKAHEVAVMTGMEAALKGVLAKLDPARLEERIATRGGIGDVLKSKKARYWETYEKMYAEIADQAENDFQELFAREFARAYQSQLDKLK
ncbi:type VI secretion system-associated FHA domain protein TagH [Ostreiculturibacter nitratireducens]|uniref:type VI secretion system-associated FHA domain protein TagH n=1 Tax=Ostreiculturibacter nitratireducens TaxID=3075226 RepID=UPI0031B61DE3